MDVELLVVANCPNTALAFALIRDALTGFGLADVVCRTTVIGTLEQARARGFTGSPTILIDDIDPFARADAPPALACRMYTTPTGLSGVPAADVLADAFAQAAGRTQSRRP